MYNPKPTKQESLRQPYPWEVYDTTDERLTPRERLVMAKARKQDARERLREADAWGWNATANRRYDTASRAVWAARWRLWGAWFRVGRPGGWGSKSHE